VELGYYKYNKNGIRDKQEYVQPHLKMITGITKTSKRIRKDGRWKYLYTYRTNKKVTIFRYAFSDEEACNKFRGLVGIRVNYSKKLKSDSPTLDILLNNRIIITN